MEKLNQSCIVELYSDSKYVIDALTKGWLTSWIKNGWRKADKKAVLNVDLWQRLLPLLEKGGYIHGLVGFCENKTKDDSFFSKTDSKNKKQQKQSKQLPCCADQYFSDQT